MDDLLAGDLERPQVESVEPSSDGPQGVDIEPFGEPGLAAEELLSLNSSSLLQANNVQAQRCFVGILACSVDLIGCPPEPPDKRFDKAIRLRMRQADYELVKDAADRPGLSVSAWTRERLIREAERELASEV